MRWVITIFIADLMLWVAATVDEDVPYWLQTFMTFPQEKLDKVHSRTKRSLYNFQSMIHCVQPWANVLSLYGDYGCYCGFKGHGQPLDDTDKCCYFHDKCYDNADSRAETFSEMTAGSYFSNYEFDCVDKKVTCTGSKSKYLQSICECDRQAAECFLRSRKSYSSKLFNIDIKKYCGEKPNFDDFHLGVHTLSKLYTCNLLPEHDRCCVDKGYNSAYKTCCGGSLRSKLATENGNIRCCGDRFYDPRSHICCYGVLHPNALHMKCCGTMGAKVDTTIAKCVYGKPVLLREKEVALNSTSLL